MKRRDFVSMLIGATVTGRLIVPNRRFFLPPRPLFRYGYDPGSGEHTVSYLGKFDSSLRDVSTFDSGLVYYTANITIPAGVLGKDDYLPYELVWTPNDVKPRYRKA